MIIYEPVAEHLCPRPATNKYLTGTIYRCEKCGSLWKIEYLFALGKRWARVGPFEHLWLKVKGLV